MALPTIIPGTFWFDAGAPTGTNAAEGQFYINSTDDSIWYKKTNSSSGWVQIAAPLPTFTQGSVIFAGVGGTLAQDNANFFWDNTGKALSMGGGSAAGVSIANKGRVIYDEVAQRFKASLNTSAYFEIGTLSGALTTGSVLFANSLGQVAQNNANFFFATATARLGIGLAAPAVSLDVVNATAAQNVVKIRSTITSGYSAIELVSANALNLTTGAIGFGNSTVGIAHFQSKHFWLSGDAAANIPNIVFGSTTVNAFEFQMVNTQVGLEMASGTSGGLSGANRGRLIYSAGGDQAFRVSENGGSFATLAKQGFGGSFTLGSVPFANATNGLIQNNANFFWDNTNILLRIGAAIGAGASQYKLTVINSGTGNNVAWIQNSSTDGFSSVNFGNNAGTFQTGFGFGNSTVTPTHLRGIQYMYSDSPGIFALVNATRSEQTFGFVSGSTYHEMANGSGAAVSTASTGRLRYNTTGQKSQMSFNGAAYFDVATYAAALTTASIPFANASNQLAQDNTAFFWTAATDTLNVVGLSTDYAFRLTGSPAFSIMRMRNTATTGVAGIDIFDSGDVQRIAFGYANSAFGVVRYRLNTLLFSTADVIFDNGTAIQHQFGMTTGSAFYAFADGAAAAVSAADTARLRYSDAGAALQLSFDGSSYRDIPVLTTALTTGSVLFAASGRINEDNANLFWDDTTNRLGINDATPSEALDVTGSINMTVSLFRGGTKVVGAQGAAVADAAGGAFIDAEARTAINDLLARLRAATGHGLIA